MNKKILIIVGVIVVVGIIVLVSTRNKSIDQDSSDQISQEEVSTENTNTDTAADTIDNTVDDTSDDTITNETVNNTSMTTKADQIKVTPVNSGPFPYYWAAVSIGTGYKSEVYLNGNLIDKVEGFTTYTVNKKANDFLKNGANELTIKVLDVTNDTKSYYKKELMVYLTGTDNSKDYKFNFSSSDLKEIVTVTMKDDELKKGTYNYTFTLKK